MSTHKILWYVILAILIMGIGGTSSLVYEEMMRGDICPKLVGIPACYIILLCFLIPFLAHLLSLNMLYYLLGTSIAFSIALYGTVMQLIGNIECPRTSSGIPMCFISLAFFFGLIVLKMIAQNKRSMQ